TLRSAVNCGEFGNISLKHGHPTQSTLGSTGTNFGRKLIETDGLWLRYDVTSTSRGHVWQSVNQSDIAQCLPRWKTHSKWLTSCASKSWPLLHQTQLKYQMHGSVTLCGGFARTSRHRSG